MFLILNKKFKEIAEITSFYSILWNELYLDKTGGDFEIQLPLEEYNYIKKDWIIYNTKTEVFGIIDTIKKEDVINDDIEKIITISGKMGVSILQNRVIFPKVNKKGSIQNIVYDLLEENFNNPSVTSRKLDIVYTYDYYSQTSEEVTISVKGNTVGDVVESLCSRVECGMRLIYSRNSGHILLETKISPDVSDSVVFCKEDNNLNNFTYLTSNSKVYTHCIVEGEDNTSATITNESKTGMYRKELYVDKTNVKKEGLTDADYMQQLKDEGKTELSKYQKEEASEFDIILNNYEYGKDFKLGSIVTLKYTDLDVDLKVRVLGVLTAIDENGIEEITLTLGNVTEVELKEDEEQDNEEETEPTTSIKDIPTSNTKYIPVYSELGEDKIVGGIFKIADNTYLLTLTCNYEDSDLEYGRIYYECDEDLLKNETVLNIRTSFGMTTLDCSSTKEDNKFYYTLDGMCGYFSYTKIITRGTKEPGGGGSTDIDDSVTYYAIPLTIKPAISQWVHYKDSFISLEPGNPETGTEPHRAMNDMEYVAYNADNSNASISSDDGFFNLLYLDDYKDLLNSTVTIEFGYTGKNTNFFVTEEEYKECENVYSIDITSKNLIASGYAKPIYEGAKYVLPVDCKIYICTSTEDADGITIKSAENKYATVFKSFQNTNKETTNTSIYNVKLIENAEFVCSNGDLESDGYRYTIANYLKQMSGYYPETEDLGGYFEDFIPENYNIKPLDGSELEIEKYTDYGYLILIKDVRGLYSYTNKMTVISE